MVPYSPSSDSGEKKEETNQEWDSPYDYLFQPQLQQQQQGLAKKRDTGTEKCKKPMHIVIFNHGRQGEGVHAIEYPRHSGSNVILAFESYKDCQRFAKILGRQMESVPMPQQIMTDNLTRYADGLGMAIQIIPEGINLNPPDESDVHDRGLADQVPLLMKLKEQKANLDRLIGESHSPPLADREFGHAWG